MASAPRQLLRYPFRSPCAQCHCHPPCPAPLGRSGERAQGLTSGQNSITSRYGVTSAHWARHCSRLVCWRALCGAQQRGGLFTTALPVLGLAWGGWWQPPGSHCPSSARGMAPGPRNHSPACAGAATGSGYQHVPAPRMCHKGTFVQLCWGRSSPVAPLPGPALPMTSLLPHAMASGSSQPWSCYSVGTELCCPRARDTAWTCPHASASPLPAVCSDPRGTCRAALLPGTASGPAHWHSPSAPSPPPGCC